MNVLHEIVDWAQNLPGWQADAVRRLLAQGELDEGDEAEILAMYRGKYQLLAKDKKAPLPQTPSRVDVSATSGKQCNIKLLSLRDLANVNAIAGNQALKFGIDGVTVVYGRNASGKSGYARVLKRACRARDTNEPIHPNLFGGAVAAVPTAVFDLKVDGQEQPVTWEEGKPCPDELADFAVLDSRCARIYVDEKNDVSYVPYGMDIFQKLVELCNRFRALMVNERDAINTHPAFLDEYDMETETGKLVAGINANASMTLIEQKAYVSEEEKARFSELDQFLKRTEVESPKARANVLRRLKTRILRLKEDVEPAKKALSEENVTLLESLQSKMEETAEASTVASEEAFKDMPLEGVGSDPWRALFDAAKAYSESHADPGLEFPVVGPDSRCVLCQQVLDDAAKERFQRFKDFIINRTAAAADKARHDFESKRGVFLATKVDVKSQHAEVLTEIEEREAVLAEQMRLLLATLKPKHEAVGRALNTGDWSSIPETPACDLTTLDTLANTLEDEAKACDDAGEPEELKERRRECAELAQRMLATSHLTDILSLIESLKHRDRLEKCIAGLDTRAITRKNSDLMDAVTTEALREALDEEFRLFNIHRLRVSLDRTGSKGITFHQLRLATQLGTKTLLSEILSEGEHRVVAIASFLAELSIAPGESGIVFDDPVCSLDHEFREKVAKRLVREGMNRQVIIFTHDIVFLLALERHATEQQVPLRLQEIRREGQEVGRCRDDLPWEAQTVKKRIGYLKKLLQEDIKQSEQDQELYASTVERFYNLLRETWERTVEEVLLNDTLQRFNPSIQTQRLKAVNVSDDDFRRIDMNMTKCSALMAGHDSAPAVGAPSPPIDELKDDLAELETFISEIRKRGEMTKQSRDQLLRPPKV